LPGQAADADGGYVIELARDRIAVPHAGDSTATVESVRGDLFKDSITSLRMNDRGECHLGGRLVPFPTLLKAFATPPDDARRDQAGKLVVTTIENGREQATPRWLGVKLPASAQPTDPVFQSRLRQLASAADQIGLRHGLFPEDGDKTNH
jgi:hypothetical protein